MRFTVNKEQFINSILSPSSKLTDNLLLFSESIKTGQNFIKTLTTSSDNSAILLSHCKYEGDIATKLIIPEIKTFLRLFSNIEEDYANLTINDNQIFYEDKKFSFKYFLLDEEYYTTKKSLNEAKLKALKYDNSFDITKNKFSEIIKYNAIIPEAEKVYFFTEKDRVYAQLGDKQKPNINEITTIISDNVNGPSLVEPIPLNIQTLLLLTFNTNSTINVSINTELKIIKFSSEDLTYILSGLVK